MKLEAIIANMQDARNRYPLVVVEHYADGDANVAARAFDPEVAEEERVRFIGFARERGAYNAATGCTIRTAAAVSIYDARTGEVVRTSAV